MFCGLISKFVRCANIYLSYNFQFFSFFNVLAYVVQMCSWEILSDAVDEKKPKRKSKKRNWIIFQFYYFVDFLLFQIKFQWIYNKLVMSFFVVRYIVSVLRVLELWSIFESLALLCVEKFSVPVKPLNIRYCSINAKFLSECENEVTSLPPLCSTWKSRYCGLAIDSSRKLQ